MLNATVLQAFIMILMYCWNMPTAFGMSIIVCTKYFRQLKLATAIYVLEDTNLFYRDVSMLSIRSPVCRDVDVNFYNYLAMMFDCSI